MASELAHGYLMRGLIRRGNQIGYGFGLREVYLTVEEGPLGVFSWIGHPAAVLDQKLQYLVEDITRAVTRDFCAVFACVAVRGAEDAHKDFVDDV